MEAARHPFPVSSTARTIGEQKAKVKIFCNLVVDQFEFAVVWLLLLKTDLWNIWIGQVVALLNLKRLQLREGFMARIWKEPHRGDGLYWKRPEGVERRLSQGAQNPTLIPQEDILVRVASFTFRFVSIEHLRDCLAYFQQKTHPGSRVPAKELASQFGDDWRTQRSWEVERWFERLPMYLLEEPKREKVLRALGEALHLEESGKLSASQTTASRKARADFKAFDKIMRLRGGKRPRAGDELPPRTRGK
jgi:hypothetical protein